MVTEFTVYQSTHIIFQAVAWSIIHPAKFIVIFIGEKKSLGNVKGFLLTVN